MLAPEAHLARQRLAGEGPALPAREILVLGRQRRQGGGAAGAEGAVERRQLTRHDGLRPAVEGDVVDGEEQHALPLREAVDGQPEQRHPPVVEMRLDVESAQPTDLRHPVGSRQALEIDDGELDHDLRMDDLHRPRRVFPEARPQHLVAVDDRSHRPPQAGEVELPLDQHQRRQGVGGLGPRFALPSHPVKRSLARERAGGASCAPAGRRRSRGAGGGPPTGAAVRSRPPGRRPSAPRRKCAAAARRRRSPGPGRPGGWRAANDRRARRSRRALPPARPRAPRPRARPAAPRPDWTAPRSCRRPSRSSPGRAEPCGPPCRWASMAATPEERRPPAPCSRAGVPRASRARAGRPSPLPPRTPHTPPARRLLAGRCAAPPRSPARPDDSPAPPPPRRARSGTPAA